MRENRRIDVFFDTSALFGANWTGSEIALLKNLAKNNFIRLWLSETTLNELKKQWTEKFKGYCDDAIGFHRSVSQDVFLPKGLIPKFNSKISNINIERTAHLRFGRIIKECGFKD